MRPASRGQGGSPPGMSTCRPAVAGSGRGGGYKTTTYSAWADVVWDWFGNTRSFGKLEGAAEENTSFSENDSHQDRVYNEGTRAYLETGEPPLVAPEPPTGVNADVFAVEVAEEGSRSNGVVPKGRHPCRPVRPGCVQKGQVTSAP